MSIINKQVYRNVHCSTQEIQSIGNLMFFSSLHKIIFINTIAQISLKWYVAEETKMRTKKGQARKIIINENRIYDAGKTLSNNPPWCYDIFHSPAIADRRIRESDTFHPLRFLSDVNRSIVGNSIIRYIGCRIGMKKLRAYLKPNMCQSFLYSQTFAHFHLQ